MARKSNKTIITCAVTGAIHTPTMSDALPYTYDDIASQAIEAAEAGASILHLHARDPETGAPSVDPKDFSPFLGRIKQASDAVVNISTGGSLTLSIQDRIKPAATFSAEMCSMNMGSMNFQFDYTEFQGDLPGAGSASATRMLFQPSLPYCME